jgi:hypothetical protein
MFSFRHDKMGFFAGLSLILILALTAVGTVLVWVFGGWEALWHGWLIRVILAIAWVLLITMVLVRIGVFRWQMLRAERQQPPPPPEENGQPPPGEDSHPPGGAPVQAKDPQAGA